MPKTISGKIRRVQLRSQEVERRRSGTREANEYFEEDFRGSGQTADRTFLLFRSVEPAEVHLGMFAMTSMHQGASKPTFASGRKWPAADKYQRQLSEGMGSGCAPDTSQVL
jgi:hypothetical protein